MALSVSSLPGNSKYSGGANSNAFMDGGNGDAKDSRPRPGSSVPAKKRLEPPWRLTRPGGSFSLCLGEEIRRSYYFFFFLAAFLGAFFAAFFLATVRPPKRLGETWTEFLVKLLNRYSPLLMPHSRISGAWAEATSRMSPHPHTRGLNSLSFTCGYKSCCYSTH